MVRFRSRNDNDTMCKFDHTNSSKLHIFTSSFPLLRSPHSSFIQSTHSIPIFFDLSVDDGDGFYCGTISPCFSTCHVHLHHLHVHNALPLLPDSIISTHQSHHLSQILLHHSLRRPASLKCVIFHQTTSMNSIKLCRPSKSVLTMLQ